jgi:putative NIF3 family GTP cyclohydrolase 1 type 2
MEDEKMADVHELVRSLDDLLEPAAFDDMGPNGLQVPGARQIDRVVTGVTAQRELFERAAEAAAQLVLVHHGLFWNFAPVGLTPLLAERLRPLFRHDIALAAYHLPLDAHAEVGNNALLADALGAAGHVAFADVGRGATFAEPVPAAELFARVAEVTGREPLVYDAFLTGEPKENVMADAREAGIHFIAAGHYATETFGVRRLGDWLAERFGVEHLWVDIPNPV